MAAPVVSGTVALMLQANPNLTPNLIKAILQYTAQEYPGYSPLRQGAGFLNTLGAVRLAKFYVNPRAGRPDADAVGLEPPDSLGQPPPDGRRHQADRERVGDERRLGHGEDPGHDAATTSCGARCPTGDNVVWGTSSGDNVVWGTAAGDNVVWGTSFNGDNVVWGTMASRRQHRVGHRLRRRRLRQRRVGRRVRRRQHRLGHGLRRRQRRVGHVDGRQHRLGDVGRDDDDVTWGSSGEDEVIFPDERERRAAAEPRPRVR